MLGNEKKMEFFFFEASWRLQIEQYQNYKADDLIKFLHQTIGDDDKEMEDESQNDREDDNAEE